VCHCSNCKQRTGSAFGISTYFRRAEVVETTGATKAYAFHHAAQGHDQERHFCATCGTTLFWYISSKPDLIGIAGGCFDEAALAAMGEPALSATHTKKLAWLTLPSAWRTMP